MNYRLGALIAIATLALTAPGNAKEFEVRDITQASEVSTRATEFANDLKQLHISANLSCTHLVSITDENGQTSFGGICDMAVANKKPETIMLCNDTMIGMLTVKASGFTINKAALTSFTEQNCAPGG